MHYVMHGVTHYRQLAMASDSVDSGLRSAREAALVIVLLIAIEPDRKTLPAALHDR